MTQPEEAPAPLTDRMVAAMMGVLDAHGVATQVAGKIVGGVMLAPPYYAHALYMEGCASPPAFQAPVCHALLAAATDAGDVQLLPASEADMLVGRPHLPRDAAVLALLLSPAATAAFRWRRLPGVVVFGVALPDDDALERAEGAGLPVTPSMIGPHAEEIITALEVHLKSFRFPEHKAHVLLDWGFVVFGSDLEDAAAVYDTCIATHLLGRSPVLSAGAGARTPTAAAASGVGSASSTLGPLHSASAAGAGAGTSNGSGPLTSLLGRLLSRTTSEASHGHDAAASGALAAGSGGSALGALSAAAGGRRVSGPSGGCGGPLSSAAGEVLTPVTAAPMAAALAAVREAHAAAVCAGAAPVVGTAGIVRRLSIGGLSSSANGALTAVQGAAAAKRETVPDHILRAPGCHKGAHDSDHHKLPSFSTGMRPW